MKESRACDWCGEPFEVGERYTLYPEGPIRLHTECAALGVGEFQPYAHRRGSLEVKGDRP